MARGRTVVLIETPTSTAHALTATMLTGKPSATLRLSGYPATFTQVHPGPGCIDPGINAADGEAILDVEWATAAAPAANMKLASCQDVLLFGGFLALQNILQEAPLPDAVSISYVTLRPISGPPTTHISIVSMRMPAQSAFGLVAAGDSGAAINDDHQSYASYGINVNAFASTPNNVAVGAPTLKTPI